MRNRADLPPSARRAYQHDCQTLVRERPGERTIIRAEGNEIKWATTAWVSSDFLEAMSEGRKRNRRAPLGDSHGAWQKVAEVDYNWLCGKIPPEVWQDKKYFAKLLNDSDNRAFRCDGDHRRL